MTLVMRSHELRSQEAARVGWREASNGRKCSNQEARSTGKAISVHTEAIKGCDRNSSGSGQKAMLDKMITVLSGAPVKPSI